MNQLKDSPSPYLQEFIDSEVDWKEFSKDAYQEAQREGKLIHLSIGRFQHPNQAREKAFFKDKRRAMTYNQVFVNVKLDADMHPEIARRFTIAVETLAGTKTGLTSCRYPIGFVFNPDTYLIAQSKVGLEELSEGDFGENKPIHITSISGEPVTQDSGQQEAPNVERILNGTTTVKPRALPNAEEIVPRLYKQREAILNLAQQKIDVSVPMYGNWIKLLLQMRQFEAEQSAESAKALDLVLVTLTQWLRSRDFDHISGGVYHFQRHTLAHSANMTKTLSANTFALELLTEALAVSEDELLSNYAREIADFVLSKLAHTSGLFCTAYLNETNPSGTFKRQQVKRLLTEDENLVIATLYGLDRRPNWEGQWMLERQGSWRSVVDQMFFSPLECEELLASGRAKLKAEELSQESIWRDERCLLRPNAQLAHCLFRLGKAVNEDRYAKTATELVLKIVEELSDSRGNIKLSKESDRKDTSLLDYALLIRVILQVLEREWSQRLAIRLQVVVEQLHDRFLTDSEQIKSCDLDESGMLYALPSSDRAAEPNPLPVVREVMQLYGTLFKDNLCIRMANQLLESSVAIAELLHHPFDHSLLEALKHQVGKVTIVLRGPKHLCDTWTEQLRPSIQSWHHIFFIPYSVSQALPFYLPRMMIAEEREQVVAYVAWRLHLVEPFYGVDELVEKLNSYGIDSNVPLK